MDDEGKEPLNTSVGEGGDKNTTPHANAPIKTNAPNEPIKVGEENSGAKYTYDKKSDNPTIDLAYNFFASRGDDMLGSEFQYAIDGDFRLLRDKYKEDTHALAYVDALEKEFSSVLSERQAGIDSMHEYISTISKDGWKGLEVFLSSKLSQQEKTMFNESVQYGGEKAIAMIQYFSTKYGWESDVTTEQGRKSPIRGNAGGGGLSPEKISPEQFKEKQKELIKKHGNLDAAKRTPEYKELTNQLISLIK